MGNVLPPPPGILRSEKSLKRAAMWDKIEFCIFLLVILPLAVGSAVGLALALARIRGII